MTPLTVLLLLAPLTSMAAVVVMTSGVVRMVTKGTITPIALAGWTRVVHTTAQLTLSTIGITYAWDMHNGGAIGTGAAAALTVAIVAAGVYCEARVRADSPDLAASYARLADTCGIGHPATGTVTITLPAPLEPHHRAALERLTGNLDRWDVDGRTVTVTRPDSDDWCGSPLCLSRSVGNALLDTLAAAGAPKAAAAGATFTIETHTRTEGGIMPVDPDMTPA